jgi:hypothetical protein
MRLAAAAISLWVLAAAGCGTPPRLALDPIPVQDDDRYDIPAPKFYERDDYYDLLDRTFFDQAEQLADLPRNARKLAGKPKPARNVTPLDEIQDSTWFTNRAFAVPLSVAEMRRGPLTGDGPDRSGPWTIVAGKTQGVTPGFTIEDARGARYVLKFDPLSDPELATGAEAIGTRLFWALGYNVAENHLVSFTPEILSIGAKATVRLPLGKKRPMTHDDLDVILAKVPRSPDGSIRAIASRFLSGKPLGPIPFLGVRRDDPNDVIPHEHRRELRGYRVFCAWTNHNDCREINSLDMYVEEDGRHFVKHYLIDFGATLGSASTGVNLRSEGAEYIFDLGQMGWSLATLGLYQRPWTKIEYPVIPGVGRFEAAHFDPLGWKPNYPLPIFQTMTMQDGFWAAKRVMAIDDSLLRAAVESAEFSDPRATEFLFAALRERRDRIGRTFFARVNPLDRFAVVAAPSKPGGDAGPAALRFEDLAVRHGFEAPRTYEVAMHSGKGRLAAFTSPTTEIPLDRAAVAASGEPVVIAIQSRRKDGGRTPVVRVTLLPGTAGGWRIVRIERDA